MKLECGCGLGCGNTPSVKSTKKDALLTPTKSPLNCED